MRNIKIAWAKKTSVGYWSEDIGPKEFEALQQITPGCRLVLKEIAGTDRKGNKFVGFVFEFIPAEEVSKLKNKFKPQTPVKEIVDDDI